MIKKYSIGILCGLLSTASFDMHASQPLTKQAQLEKNIKEMLAKPLDQWTQQHIETIKQKIAELKPTAPGPARTLSDELARLGKQYTAGAEAAKVIKTEYEKKTQQMQQELAKAQQAFEEAKKKHETTEQKLEQELANTKKMLDDRIRIGRDSLEKYKGKETAFGIALNHLKAEKAMTENTLGGLREAYTSLSEAHQELQANQSEMLEATRQLRTKYEADIVELRNDIQAEEDINAFKTQFITGLQGQIGKITADNTAMKNENVRLQQENKTFKDRQRVLDIEGLENQDLRKQIDQLRRELDLCKGGKLGKVVTTGPQQ
jgi:DNA repair exonuclease SbcCD ATPase subunit